jgi:hypothetical protein
MNPFRFGQVVQGKDFCPRPVLLDALAVHIDRGQNVYVQGERRVGKTSLVCEAARLRKRRTIYIDLLGVKTAEDVARRIVTAVLAGERQAGYLEKILKTLATMRPSVGIDPMTGLPSISIAMASPVTTDTVAGAIDLIQACRQPLMVVFDEFQDIMRVEDSRTVLAVMRSRIQFQGETPYIFCGSVRHSMDSIFINADSPFFKSALPVVVGPLERERFQEFLGTRFAASAIPVAPSVFDRVFDLCMNIPGDVQQMCAALWECGGEKGETDPGLIEQCLGWIWAQEVKGYEMTLQVLSPQQLKVLSGIARLGGHAPMSSDFLREIGGVAASSAKAALVRLMTLNVVYLYDGDYRFTNPFFRAWVIHKHL